MLQNCWNKPSRRLGIVAAAAVKTVALVAGLKVDEGTLER